MARTRLLHPDFFVDDVLGTMPLEDSLCFQGLWVFSDREGRLEDKPKKLRALIFPYRDVDVDESLDRLHAGEFINRYEANGKRYIQVKNFLKYQHPHPKEAQSAIPSPASGEPCNYIASNLQVSDKQLASTDLGCVEPGVSNSVSVSVSNSVSVYKDPADELKPPPVPPPAAVAVAPVPKKKKEKVEKPADPRHAPAVKALCTAFEGIRKSPYAFAGKDAAAVTALLKMGSDEEILRRWEMSLQAIGFNRCDDLARFASMWNTYAGDGPPKPINYQRIGRATDADKDWSKPQKTIMTEFGEELAI